MDESPNALAGPSRPSLPPSIPPLSSLLLERGNTSPSPLSGSQDLLSLFGLKPLYDKYVRPYPTATALTNNKSGAPETDEGKGKGKASTSGGLTSIGFSMGGVRIGGEVLVKTEAVVGEKSGKRLKLEKSYAHLVEDIPGRNTIKKDKYLNRLVLNPDVQPFKITPLDDHTLREAFTLQPGQIPGFDSLIWESEDPSTIKKKKKKRKGDSETKSGSNGTATGGGGEEDHRKSKKRKGGSELSPLREEV